MATIRVEMLDAVLMRDVVSIIILIASTPGVIVTLSVLANSGYAVINPEDAGRLVRLHLNGCTGYRNDRCPRHSLQGTMEAKVVVLCACGLYVIGSSLLLSRHFSCNRIFSHKNLRKIPSHSGLP